MKENRLDFVLQNPTYFMLQTIMDWYNMTTSDFPFHI